MLDKLNKSDLHRYMKNGSKNKKLNFVAFWPHGLARKYTFTTTFTEQSLLVLHYFFFFSRIVWTISYIYISWLHVCMSVCIWTDKLHYISWLHVSLSLCLSVYLASFSWHRVLIWSLKNYWFLDFKRVLLLIKIAEGLETLFSWPCGTPLPIIHIFYHLFILNIFLVQYLITSYKAISTILW